MKAVFTFTPAESKRLIAKGVAQSEPVREAMDKAYVIIPGGTTNGFVAQELTGLEVAPQAYTAGISVKGVLCVTPAGERDDRIPIVLYKGERVDKTMVEAFEDFHVETVVIKGANAVDPEGNVGVITSGFDGGTVSATIGYMTSTGMRYVFPVGLEKLVPSVPEAARWVGSKTMDYAMGATFGMYCLSNGLVVTELQALQVLSGAEVGHIASGGIGGSDGGRIPASAFLRRASGTGRRPTTSVFLAFSKRSSVRAHDGTPPSSCGMSKRFSRSYSIIQRRKPIGDSATMRTSL